MNFETIPVLDYTWHIIANPNACENKSLDHWSEVAKRFDEVGLKYELCKTEKKGKGIEKAAQLCREGHRHLMVVGGDGSINEVVNGIMMSGVEVNDVCLAVLPLGRGNDWARTHHYPTKAQECVELFLRGTFIRHDIGKVQTFQEGREVSKRFFINIAGFGFDADPAAVELTMLNAKKAGVADRITVKQQEIKDFAAVSGQNIVCNPPYGERMLDVEQARGLYRVMSKVIPDDLPCSIITPDSEFEKCFGRKARKRRKLYNGMMQCQLYQYW